MEEILYLSNQKQWYLLHTTTPSVKSKHYSSYFKERGNDFTVTDILSN